ncbi:acyl carrier protein [Sphingomonas sp. PB4P5]|uniref:acyl carrier protein n=1 Tax=Parasphingomonas puruogangriensis TaxID=3096155 RepID=UPI002FC98365
MTEAFNMKASLGLAGDLDDVELVEDIEQAFGVRLPDGELSNCDTVGDLFDLVLARLPDRGATADRCATAMCFYRLRRVVQRLAPGIQLLPSTPIDALRTVSVRSLYEAMEIGEGLRPPNPYLSRWGALSLLIAIAGPIGLRFAGASWWLAGAALALGVILYRFSPVRLPPQAKTVRDFIELVAALNICELSAQGARLRPAEAWQALQALCSDHAASSAGEINRETLIHGYRLAAL